MMKEEKDVVGPTEIWTRIAGFKVQSANHYTMGPSLLLWYTKQLKKQFFVLSLQLSYVVNIVTYIFRDKSTNEFLEGCTRAGT